MGALALPPGQNLPRAARVHTVDCVDPAYEPGRQFKHAGNPAVEYLPMAQGVHTESPVVMATVPGLHCVQVVCPTVEVKYAMAHAMQTVFLSPAANLP